MMSDIKKILKDWFTEVDNSTFDVTKALAVVSILTGLGLAITAVVLKNQMFDFQAFGIGVAALFAGVGMALGMKKDTKESNVDDISGK
jgi:hypothetical protein